MPEEVKEEAKKEKRGGTEENAPRPIKDPGQSITIHAVSDGSGVYLETPSLAKEFLK